MRDDKRLAEIKKVLEWRKAHTAYDPLEVRDMEDLLVMVSRLQTELQGAVDVMLKLAEKYNMSTARERQIAADNARGEAGRQEIVRALTETEELKQLRINHLQDMIEIGEAVMKLQAVIAERDAVIARQAAEIAEATELISQLAAELAHS